MMSDQRWAYLRPLFIALGLSSTFGVAADVIVVDAPAGQVYAKAGLEPGDALLAWRLDDADGGLVTQGHFNSVFDVHAVSMKQAPRGPVTVFFERDGEQLDTIMPSARTWVGDLRPAWAVKTDREANRILDALEDNPIDQTAISTLDALAASVEPLDAAWLLHRAARKVRGSGNHNLADVLSIRALALADRVGHPVAGVSMTRDNAIQLFQSGNPNAGLALFEETLRRAKTFDPDNLVTSLALNNLAIAYANRSEFDRARERAGAALDIRERLAPASLSVAESLHTLGNVEFWTDHLDEAATYFLRALAIREQHDPNGLPVARNLQVLANVDWRRGRLDDADALMLRSSELFVANSANEGYLAEMHVTLGHLASDRGHYRDAERRYLRALDLFEAFAPGTKNYADTLHALGVVALARADDDVARVYEARALEIYAPLQGEGQRVALVLTNLGRIALRRSELDVAEEYFARSLTIIRAFASDGYLVASRIADLGDVARTRGDQDQAENHYREALDILETTAPDSLRISTILTKLGALAATDSASIATEYLERALAIAVSHGPGTLYEARPAYELAMLSRETNRDTAIAYFQQSINALDAQRRLIGGPDDVNARFAAQFEHFYKDYLRYLADLDLTDAALDILNRYRAQNLRLMLADRNLHLSELPEELQTEREQLNREYSLAYKTYRSLDGDGSVTEHRDALADLRSIRMAQQEWSGKVGGAPVDERVGAVSSIDTVRLPADSLVMSFAVLQDETLVFVRTADGTTLHRVPIDRAALTELVRRFRLLIRAPDAGDDARAALDALSHRLGAALIPPSIADHDSVTTLIVMPDDVLHLMPFAALKLGSGNASDETYVAERFAVTVADSIARRPISGRIDGRHDRTAVAFGMTQVSVTNSEPSSTLARGLALAPLPSASQEVQSISTLFGPNALGLLDEDASENRVKRAAEEAPIVHFATHGVLDDRSPLDSFLLLGTGADGSENGLLQAWEIIEQLNVDGALVALSACETALGENAAGEGILGLTRAFRIAGADTVLASLWTVRDASTSQLMSRYYRWLISGAEPPEALRQAQLEFLKGPISVQNSPTNLLEKLRQFVFGEPSVDYSHPYYWSSFQSYGSAR